MSPEYIAAEEACAVAERRWSNAKQRGDRAAAAIQMGHYRAAARIRRATRIEADRLRDALA